jgi:hypothetical protein
MKSGPFLKKKSSVVRSGSLPGSSVGPGVPGAGGCRHPRRTRTRGGTRDPPQMRPCGVASAVVCSGQEGHSRCEARSGRSKRVNWSVVWPGVGTVQSRLGVLLCVSVASRPHTTS